MASIFETKKNNKITGAQQEYDDSISSLNSQEANTKAQNQSQLDLVDKGLQSTLQQSLSQRLSDRAKTQQNRADAQRANRMRARAIGGGTSSGFLDLANRSDNQAMQELAGIDTRQAGFENQANLGAQKSRGDLASQLNEAIFKINNERMLSKRQRDQLIREANDEFESAMAEEARSRAASGGGSMYGDYYGTTPTQGVAEQPVVDPSVIDVYDGYQGTVGQILNKTFGQGSDSNFLTNYNNIATKPKVQGPGKEQMIRGVLNQLKKF